MSFISKSKKVIGLEYRFTFGKHNGELLKDILEIEPEYIIWCSDDIDWFDLDTDVYDMAVERDMAMNYDGTYDDYDQHRYIDDFAREAWDTIDI